MKNRARVRVGLMALALAVLCGPTYRRAAAQEVPEQNRKELMEALGAPFIVFREKVLDELKVTGDQREKLMQLALEQIMETGPFLESLPQEGPERNKKLDEHRKTAREKLAKNLEVLQPAQRDRLRQVILQQEGAFSLGREDVRNELKITQEQMKKFVAIGQDLQKKVESLIKEAREGGNPQEIRPKVEQLRKDHGRELEAVLTDAQKKQWKEMLGPPFELGD